MENLLKPLDFFSMFVILLPPSTEPLYPNNSLCNHIFPPLDCCYRSLLGGS